MSSRRNAARYPAPMVGDSLLLDLTVLFIGAKLGGALFARLGQPEVIGELLAGVLLGPHVLGAIGELEEAHHVFQELGAVILLFLVGLDTPLSDLRAVGGRSLAVGVSGVVVPFALGVGLMLLLGRSGTQSVFIGTALVATSVGITARVLADLGQIRSPQARIILGAAVVDDILGLLVLAVVAATVADSVSTTSIVVLGVLAIVFVALIGGLGPKLVDRLTPYLDRLGNQGVLIVSLALCLGLASLAEALRLATIIGAFLAGMALAETRDRYQLEEHLAPVYSFLVPFFFAITGAVLDPSVLIDPEIAVLTVAVTAAAIAGKLIGCGLPVRSMGRRSAWIVGVGMTPRGEVGILVASVGLAQGIIGDSLYAVVVTMSIATTIAAPAVLSSLYGTRAKHVDHPRGRDIEGIGG
jgi:Kef-type K+ transport system membrane component KefB